MKDPGDYLEVEKYSFHWQDAVGNLLKRWDNAAHHPEVVTNPHHIHDGAEENVQAMNVAIEDFTNNWEFYLERWERWLNEKK